MSESVDTLIIRLLSGSHQGAEVDLSPGDYVLGSDEDCDLLLHDGDIALQHLRLTVGNGSLRVTPLGGPVWLDGIPLTGPHPCDVFQVISLGGTHLAVGPSGTWPHLNLPELLAPATETTDPEDPIAEDAAEPILSEEAPSPPKKPQRRRPGLLLPVLLVLTVIGSLAYLAWPRDTLTAAKPPSALEQTKQIITAHEVYGLILEQPDGGTVTVSGYVDTALQRRRLERAFRASGLPIRSDITAGEDLTAAVRTTLDALDIPFQVSYRGQGRVRVSGILENPWQWRTALGMIQRDVPDLQGIDTDFTLPHNAPASTTTASTEAPANTTDSDPGYSSDATASIAPTGTATSTPQARANTPITPENTVTEAAAATIINGSVDLSGELDDLGGIIARSTDPAAADGVLPVEIALRSVGLQPVPYLITRDGRKFLQGARLRTGHIIKEIQTDRVILWHDDKEIIYHLGTRS